MVGILSGFFVVWSVILAGMFVGRRGVLGRNAQSVLSAFSFYVATPALLFEILSKAELTDIFGPPLLVATASTLTAAVLFLLLARFALKRSAAESLIGATNASLANWGNLGIPIAAFVFGDAGYVAPLIVFQLALFTPLLLVGLDATSARHSTTLWKFAVSTFRNPVIAGSVLGMVVAGTGFGVPDLVLEPVHLIAGAAVPAMLIAFGISLNGSVPLQASIGRRADILLASGFKLIVHPLLAYCLAGLILRLESPQVFAAVVMAAMPTAQNAFVIASRYETGLVATKDTVLITTLVALPAMILIGLVLS